MPGGMLSFYPPPPHPLVVSSANFSQLLPVERLYWDLPRHSALSQTAGVIAGASEPAAVGIAVIISGA